MTRRTGNWLHWCFVLIACGFAMPALADPAVPAQQSKCEIAANRFAARHPHTKPFGFMDHGFFYFASATPPYPPATYRDPWTGTTFYAESDGRHLAAIDAKGKLLWVANPFVESDLCPYRSAHPFILWLGPPGGCIGGNCLGPFTPTPDAKMNAILVKELRNEIARGRKVNRPRDGARFIGLSFNSSQYGYVNIANGYFYPMGQN